MTIGDIHSAIVAGLHSNGFSDIRNCSEDDGILIRAKMVKDGVEHASHVHIAHFEVSGHSDETIRQLIEQRLDLAHRIVGSSVESAQQLARMAQAAGAKDELENARIATLEALAGENQRLRDENRMLRTKMAEALGLLPTADTVPATPSLPDINW